MLTLEEIEDKIAIAKKKADDERAAMSEEELAALAVTAERFARKCASAHRDVISFEKD